jgi:hypothetical protein
MCQVVFDDSPGKQEHDAVQKDIVAALFVVLAV